MKIVATLLALVLAGCSPTLVAPAPPDGSPNKSLATSLSIVTTSSGLQTSLNNAQPFKPITISGTIALSKPLVISRSYTDLSGGTLTYSGKDGAIQFANTPFGVKLHDMAIETPNGPAWTNTTQTRRATFSDMLISAGGAHLNFETSAPDGIYFPSVRNVNCIGTGAIVKGNVRGGLIENITAVNNHFSDDVVAMIDLKSPATGGLMTTITGGWFEGIKPPLRIDGNFASVRWWGNWSEPHGNGSQYSVSGDHAMLLADGVAWVAQPAEIKDGASIQLIAMPALAGTDGVNPPYTMPLDTWDDLKKTFPLLDRLRATYLVTGDTSLVTFPGGNVSKAAAKVTTIEPATTKPVQPSN